MGDGTSSISPDDLYARLGLASPPTIVDIRRDAPDPESGRMIVSAFHCAPEEVKRWPHVMTCNQRVARALRAAEVSAPNANASILI
jgi:hypothetical protein